MCLLSFFFNNNNPSVLCKREEKREQKNLMFIIIYTVLEAKNGGEREKETPNERNPYMYERASSFVWLFFSFADIERFIIRFEQ